MDTFILEVLSIPSLWQFFKVYEANDLLILENVMVTIKDVMIPWTLPSLRRLRLTCFHYLLTLLFCRKTKTTLSQTLY